MLQSIYIQNYALIDKLEMNFYPGFSVITGETGAGKSIILGAIQSHKERSIEKHRRGAFPHHGVRHEGFLRRKRYRIR